MDDRGKHRRRHHHRHDSSKSSDGKPKKYAIDNLTVRTDLTVEENAKIKGNLKVEGTTSLTNFSASGSGAIAGNLSVGGTVSAADIIASGTIKPGKGLILPFVDISTTPPGPEGDIIYDNVNKTVYVSDGTQWTRIPNGSPITGTITIGSPQFPTVQSAFDFLEGKAVDNVLIDLVAPAFGVKIYDELVFGRDTLSVASQGFAMSQSQYPLNSFSELEVVIPGLSMRGDDRYAAGTVYVDGTEFNVFSDKRPGAGNGYVSNLGTPYGMVDLVRPGPGQIQVVITDAPAFNPDSGAGGQEISQPDFVAAGVLPNDHIMIRDDTGVSTEFIIGTVSGNIFGYNGDVTALGPQSELTLLPRVQIMKASSPATFGVVNLSNLGMTMQGVWIRNPANGDVLEVWNNSYVKLQQCFIDGRGASGICISTTFGGVVGTETSGVRMHNATIGGFAGLLMADAGRMDDGDWVFTDGFFNVFILEAISQGHFNSANVVGGFINWFQELGSKTDISNLLGIYSSGMISLLLNDASQLSLQVDNLQIESNSEFGVIVNDAGVFALSGGDGNSGAPYSSKVVNCDIAFSLDAQATVALENAAPFLIDNANFGFAAVAGARIGVSNEITYGSGVGTNRAIEVGAQYIAAKSTETPGNVLTYTKSGVLDSTIPTQVIDQPAGIVLTLDPTSVQTSANISVYIGKHFVLTTINISPNNNTLTLQGGAHFIGAGTIGLTSTSVTFGSNTSSGSGIDFTVLSPSLVRINSIVNGSVSFAAVKDVVPTLKLTKRVKPKINLSMIPARYQAVARRYLS